MIKYLLTFIAIIANLSLSAQINPCTPDASLQDSIFGLWPDTTQNLPLAQIDLYYEEHIQIKTPATVGEVMGDPYEIEVFGFPVNIAPLSIDSIKLVAVEGLPSVMSTYLSNADSIFDGDATACVTLFGTAGTSELGQHNLSLIIDGWISVTGLGTVSLYDQLGDYESIEGYKLIVQTEVSINDNKESSFKLSQNVPNPFSSSSTIEFSSPIATQYQFNIFNILGELQEVRTIYSNVGINNIEINASTLSSGIYFYTLFNDNEIITKKMIIRRN